MEKTVNFEIAYTGQYTLENSVEWNFGDGSSVTVSGPTTQHTYTDEGNYTVRATATLSGSEIGSCPKQIVTQVTL